MSATNLTIKSFQATDDITQRAASAKVVIAPAGEFPQPPVEFSGSGTAEALTGLSLRPNGLTITLKSRYDNVGQHTLFRGLLEYMDDPKDANSDVFTLVMSSMPIKQPHRIPVTQIFNNFYTDKANATNASAILSSVCKSAGLSIGRNDMPDYSVEGNWEVIHSTPVEEAQRLLNPFNMFEFVKYYVRTNADGLQIQKVDYTGNSSNGAYQLQNIISVKRHFELYMPEKRIGDLPVMLVGADIYSYASNETRPPGAGGSSAARQNANPTDDEILNGAGSIENVIQFTKTVVAKASSKNQNEIANFETWSETTTTMEVTFEIVGQNLDIVARNNIGTLVHVYTYAIGALDSILEDSLSDPLTTISFFDGDNTLVWTVKITGLRIADQKATSKLEESYDQINGLIKSAKTDYEYVDLPGGVIDTGAQFQVTLPPARLLVKETTEETIYPGGFPFVKSKTVITHNYGDKREHISTVTQQYFPYRNGFLALLDTKIEMADDFGITNAQIQAFMSGRGPKPTTGPSGDLNSGGIPPRPDPFPRVDNQSTINNTKETIGQYQLLNGTVVPIFPTPQMFRILDLAKIDFEHSTAFHISCPGMNYAGLQLVWSLCQRQQGLEHSNMYWEIVTVTCPLDTVPVVGSRVKGAGSSGYATSVEHVGDTNSALTLVTFKRLIGG